MDFEKTARRKARRINTAGANGPDIRPEGPLRGWKAVRNWGLLVRIRAAGHRCRSVRRGAPGASSEARVDFEPVVPEDGARDRSTSRSRRTTAWKRGSRTPVARDRLARPLAPRAKAGIVTTQWRSGAAPPEHVGVEASGSPPVVAPACPRMSRRRQAKRSTARRPLIGPRQRTSPGPEAASTRTSPCAEWRFPRPSR